MEFKKRSLFPPLRRYARLRIKEVDLMSSAEVKILSEYTHSLVFVYLVVCLKAKLNTLID